MINLLGWPPGLAVPLITQPLGVTSTLEEEMKISGTAGNTQTDKMMRNEETDMTGRCTNTWSGGWKKMKRSGWKVVSSRHTETRLDRCTLPSQHKHMRPSSVFWLLLLFLPSCRRWWTRPQCCLWCLPPPPRPLILQTWQTTGSYCKAERGMEFTLSELIKHSTLSFFEKMYQMKLCWSLNVKTCSSHYHLWEADVVNKCLLWCLWCLLSLH